MAQGQQNALTCLDGIKLARLAQVFLGFHAVFADVCTCLSGVSLGGFLEKIQNLGDCSHGRRGVLSGGCDAEVIREAEAEGLGREIRSVESSPAALDNKLTS